MKANSIFIVVVAFSLVFVSCKKEGCTEAHADNYDPKAKTDNGTCSYADGPYNYMLKETVHIKVGVAEQSAPVSEADCQLMYNNMSMQSFTGNGGWVSYYFDTDIFLNAGVKNGDLVYVQASAFGMSGTNWAYMNADAYLDFGYVTIQ